jgi:hypothetical protein
LSCSSNKVKEWKDKDLVGIAIYSEHIGEYANKIRPGYVYVQDLKSFNVDGISCCDDHTYDKLFKSLLGAHKCDAANVLHV